MEVLYVKSNAVLVARETILSKPADKKGREKIAHEVSSDSDEVTVQVFNNISATAEINCVHSAILWCKNLPVQPLGSSPPRRGCRRSPTGRWVTVGKLTGCSVMQLCHIWTVPKPIIKPSWASSSELVAATESKGRHEITEKPKVSETVSEEICHFNLIHLTP